MRVLFFAPFFIATAALADDFIVNPPVVSAVVHPNSATTVQKTTLSLPAGEHRVLFPMPDAWFDLPFVVKFSGGIVQQGSDIVLTELDGKTLFTPTQTTALEALESAKERLVEIQGEKTALTIRIAALQKQLNFLGSISGADTTDKTVSDLLAVAKMIGGEAANVLAEITNIEDKFYALDQRIADQTRAVTIANLAFKATGAALSVTSLVAINVSTPVATVSEITIDGFEQAGWAPSYEFHLTRGDAPEITLKRDVAITLRDGVTWQDIDLTLSSANPDGRLAPGYIHPSLAQIAKPQAEIRLSAKSLGAAADMMMPAPMVAEEATANLAGDGETVTYHFDHKVTIVGINDPTTVLHLADLKFTPEITNETHPKDNATAFVVAKFTNTSIDPIFAGRSLFFREGVLIGTEYTAAIPAKTETTLAFGPLDRIRVEHIYMNRETGDRGFLTTSNTRTEAIEFTVENLGDAHAEVRALYPTPFSEQEDLKITVAANPAPNNTNVENQRGVSAWDLTLAAGEKTTVRLNFDLSWPEGFELNWRP